MEGFRSPCVLRASGLGLYILFLSFFSFLSFFFFFAAMVFGSVLLRRPSARTTRAHASLRWGERERAVTERQRSSKPLYLPEDFMPVRPTANSSARFSLPLHCSGREGWALTLASHPCIYPRVCAAGRRQFRVFPRSDWHPKKKKKKKKQRELGSNIIVQHNRLALRGLKLICPAAAALVSKAESEPPNAEQQSGSCVHACRAAWDEQWSRCSWPQRITRYQIEFGWHEFCFVHLCHCGLLWSPSFRPVWLAG